MRAFNTMGYMYFAQQANRPDPKLAVPIAGDDAEAVRIAAGLVRDAGFEPVVVGKLADARLFQRGGPGYGQRVSAAELKKKLSSGAMTADATAEAHDGAAGRTAALDRARGAGNAGRTQPRRCGRSPISSCCSPAITCCGRCATRWALRAA